ncbi:MAG: biotin-dependent carboxyltransferase family protein [Luminiphilus sp.]
MNALQIQRAGIASSVQDSGRFGMLQMGIPPAGAMDWCALVSGQRQLGHLQDEAAIEVAYGDFVASPTDDCHIVVTGAPVSLSIDHQPVSPTSVHTVAGGQTLDIKAAAAGVYSYLHISGGVATAPQFGSRSTSPREGVGGLNGGYLRNGDVLPIGDFAGREGRADPHLITARTRETLWLRFVPGFQYAALSEPAIKDLLQSDYVVTPKANRMGVTLAGATIETGIQTLLSEATCHGAIQIPPDGQPIVLLNDRQTVGGYPKPGAVIRSDCLRLAQARPGQKIRFALCSPEEADRIQWLEQHYLETRLR